MTATSFAPRPMSALSRATENNAIYFLTDARRHKDDGDRAHYPDINLSLRRCRRPEIRFRLRHRRRLQRPRQDQGAVNDPVRRPGGGSQTPNIARVEDHARRCATSGILPGTVISYVKMAARRRHRHAARDRREPQGFDVMPIEPPEIPPATPGQPTEPPPESPPGNPRPEVPPPLREPGEPPQPQELPGKTPDELPVRGPNGPRTPNPATDRDRCATGLNAIALNAQ